MLINVLILTEIPLPYRRDSTAMTMPSIAHKFNTNQVFGEYFEIQRSGIEDSYCRIIIILPQLEVIQKYLRVYCVHFWYSLLTWVGKC